MPNKPSGSPKRPRQSRVVTASLKQRSGQRNTNNANTFRKFQGRKTKKRQSSPKNPKNQGHREEKQITYCVVAYTFSFFTASILWLLQVPNQVVYVLLIISTLLILLYLIPLRTRYTDFVNRSLLLVFITFLVAVLSFNHQEVLQILTYLFPITSN